eukprot:3187-Heterococcus_DN1.PRE.2
MTTSPLTTSAAVICRVEPPLMTVAIAGASVLKLCSTYIHHNVSKKQQAVLDSSGRDRSDLLQQYKQCEDCSTAMRMVVLHISTQLQHVTLQFNDIQRDYWLKGDAPKHMELELLLQARFA